MRHAQITLVTWSRPEGPDFRTSLSLHPALNMKYQYALLRTIVVADFAPLRSSRDFAHVQTAI